MEVAFEQLLAAEEHRLLECRDKLRAELARMESELQVVNARLSHVQALLQLERSPTAAQREEGMAQRPVSLNPMVPATVMDPIELAETILAERAPEPVHYKDLWDLVKDRGGRIEGQDPAQVLVSRLVRDERFVRPLRRGYYALRAHYPNAKNIGSRRRTGTAKSGPRRSGSKA